MGIGHEAEEKLVEVVKEAKKKKNCDNTCGSWYRCRSIDI